MKKQVIVLLFSFFYVSSSAQEIIEKLTFEGTNLEGTLNLKNKDKLVIIIAGSGPTDRDGNNKLGVNSNCYKLICDTLASKNISSFRYDKRGIGKSKVKSNGTEGTFEDLVNDLNMWIDTLKIKYNFQKIYILGHSEGSLVGILTSQKKQINGFVSLAGSGQKIDDKIMEQLKSQPDSIKSQVKNIFSQLNQKQKVDKIPTYLYALFRPSVQPFIMSWMQYDPKIEIGKLKSPVLIIQGNEDVQVSVHDAELLKSNCQNCEFQIIPNMTHTLKDINPVLKIDNTKTYKDPSIPLNMQLMGIIIDFINKN